MSARLAVLISGRGRNLQALLAGIAEGRIPAQAVAVLSNNPDAPGLQHAQRSGVPVEVVDHRRYDSRAAFEHALAAALDRHAPDLIALAGFMRLLGGDFVRHFAGRLLNIHPSLLPQYRGLQTHRRVLADGVAEHGASVHYVTAELDGGPVVVQGRLRVRPQDDEQALAARVMDEIELRIYPQAVAWAARGELQLRGDQVWFRGQPLAVPLGLDDLEEPFK